MESSDIVNDLNSDILNLYLFSSAFITTLHILALHYLIYLQKCLLKKQN
jgi:hypothetical protein